MQKLNFMHQQHLNPTTVKIKNSFVKKSKLRQQGPTNQQSKPVNHSMQLSGNKENIAIIKSLELCCEKLQMRSLTQHNNNSFNLDNAIPKIQLTISQAEKKKDRVNKLKAIQARLKGIDFGSALSLMSRPQTNRTSF